MPARRALIFGINGQDGAYLAELLLAKGYVVFGTSRDAEMSRLGNLEQLGLRQRVTVLSVSITDFRSVLQALAQAEPDEVYNLAGQSSVGLSFSQPVETQESIGLGTLNILEALRFRDRPVRFYSACSGEVFGDTDGRPADEDTPFRPRSPYAVAKATAFWQVANYRESYRLEACSGILFNHESPLRPARFVTRKITGAVARIAAGSRERLVLGDLSVRRDWGWAPEYVVAMWRMLQQERLEDFVIATGEHAALEDFTAAAFAEVGLDWRDHVDIDPALFRPSEIRCGVGNAARAAERLGWRAATRMPGVVRAMMAAERIRLSSADADDRAPPADRPRPGARRVGVP